MAPPVLETRGVGFSVGKVRLLHDVSIDAPAGEVLVVVGPNGAGKSTLLRLLAGELTPSEGDVLIDGRRLKDYSAAALAKRRAVLPQQTVLQFAFTAREVVLMGRNPHLKDGWPSKDDAHIAERAMEVTETTAFAPRSFPTLSGGEQSRVTLARVLAQEAPLLLLDEPTSSLDVRHQEQVMVTARRLAAAGACVLVILHDLNLASAYADRIAVLHDGALAACDVPAAVLRAELLREVFECEFDVMSAETDRPYVLPRRTAVIDGPLYVSGPGAGATPAVSPTAVSPYGTTGVAPRLANEAEAPTA
jgi:iron complex transport system ATP-binding protein